MRGPVPIHGSMVQEGAHPAREAHEHRGLAHEVELRDRREPQLLLPCAAVQVHHPPSGEHHMPKRPQELHKQRPQNLRIRRQEDRQLPGLIGLRGPPSLPVGNAPPPPPPPPLGATSRAFSTVHGRKATLLEAWKLALSWTNCCSFSPVVRRPKQPVWALLCTVSSLPSTGALSFT